MAAAPQRPRLGVRGAVITIGVVVVVAAGSIAAFSGEDGRRVEIAAASTVSSADASVSVELPEGWQQLPLISRLQPAEVLVLGTAARPAAEPIEACGIGDHQPAAPSAYVTIYAYGPTDVLTSPSGGYEFTPDSFVPRPDDFRTFTGSTGSCPSAFPPTAVLSEPEDEPSTSTSTSSTEPDPTTSTTLSPTTLVPPTVTITMPVFENHVFEIGFVDGDDRRFLARVIAVGDPTKALLDQGMDVLNSITVTTPSVTTTAPTLAGFDEEAAKQQIIEAINSAHGTPSSIPLALSVEGGHPFVDPEDAAAAAAQAQNSDPTTRKSYEASKEGKIVTRINWIVFDSPTYARLNFDTLVDGQPTTATTTGYAVFEDGNWREGRGTFCEVVRRGGLECPT